METNLLLIEDDPDISELVALYLRKEGYRIDAASSAEQALSLFQRSAYDMLISDIMLPGMDGMAFVQHIRNRSNIPILFLTITSKKDPQDVIAGLNIGGDDYVTKPFEPEVLVARVQAGLRRYRSARPKTAEVNGADVWKDGRLTIHKKRLEVLIDGEPVACRPRSCICCSIWRSIRSGYLASDSCTSESGGWTG
ncbi:response regulator transcription factor [Paenibacillus koleovorans]|uniref:response regulator transcription factor n=1 Tax=Paenibacillus koleovorans TaxID=121608 RepID=UPI000FD8F09F|nr:response regulator transcription factor [Paenibacillus koleovorans]